MDDKKKQKCVIWRETQSWLPSVSEWLLPKLAKNAVSRIRENKLGNCIEDHDECYRFLEMLQRDETDDLISGLMDHFNSWNIRSYHGCRTDNVQEYFDSGIKIHDREQLKEQLRYLARNDERLTWQSLNMEKRFESFSSKEREGRCFTVLDDRPLINWAGNYLIYGSEWVSNVLGHDYRHVLLDYGLPTLFHVDVPMSEIETNDLCLLIKYFLSEWVRQCAYSSYSPMYVNFSFIWFCDLPAEWIVNHSHPEVIMDPYSMTKRKFAYDKISCTVCGEV